MESNPYRDARLEKLGKLRSLGLDVWPRKAQRTHSIEELAGRYGDPEQWPNDKLEALGLAVSVMGRVLSLREMGKSVFGHLTEDGEKLQAFFRKNDLDEADPKGWEILRLLDLGDFISVSGPLMRTKTGELSVRVKTIQFLAKAHLPLPEKWHGLQDKEQRYRQRYLDLVSNPEVMATFQRRSRILAELRHYMEGQGFLEVETPMMQPIPGGATGCTALP